MTSSQPDDPRHAPQPESILQEPASNARLLTEIASLREKLAAARLRAANLEAAIRAALGAHSDGESNPLSYLRDEIYYPGDAHGA